MLSSTSFYFPASVGCTACAVHIQELPKISENIVKREAQAILKLAAWQREHTVAKEQINICTYKFYGTKAGHI